MPVNVGSLIVVCFDGAERHELLALLAPFLRETRHPAYPSKGVIVRCIFALPAYSFHGEAIVVASTPNSGPHRSSLAGTEMH
jgi:hypothetical protein